MTSGDERYVLTISGWYDLQRDTGQLAVDFPGGAISHLDEVLTPDFLFFRAKGMPNLPDGYWGSTPRDEVRAHYLLRSPGNEPEYVLRQVSEIKEAARMVRSEQVRGAPATRYSGLLPAETLVRGIAGRSQDQVAAVKAVLGEGGGAETDVWVDHHNRVVRVVIQIPGEAFGGMGVAVDMQLFGYGTAGRVTIPPAGSRLPAVAPTGILVG